MTDRTTGHCDPQRRLWDQRRKFLGQDAVLVEGEKLVMMGWKTCQGHNKIWSIDQSLNHSQWCVPVLFSNWKGSLWAIDDNRYVYISLSLFVSLSLSLLPLRFLKVGRSRPIFLYFRLFCNLIVQLVDKIFPITRFEPLISGVGSSRSCYWATTTALLPLRFSFSLTHSPSLHLNFSHSKIFKRGSIFILCRS